MIARLRGRIAEKHPHRVTVDVHGVGYELHIPLSTYYGLGEPGADASFEVHTHVREDTLALFGFSTALELRIFEQLIGISGIGPRLALAVLSGIEPAELVQAVGRGDVRRLTGIPGIGKKTAERMGLELRDRLPPVVEAGPAPEAGDGPGAPRADLVSALVNLGYGRPSAERAVEATLGAGDGSFEPALKRALKEIVR